MIFTWHKIVTTSHTVTAPLSEELVVAKGVIDHVSVHFPQGCHGLVHAVILHGAKPIFPSRGDMTLAGNDIPLEWHDYYELYSAPYRLMLKAWGNNCTYNHVLSIRMVILPKRAVVPSNLEKSLETMLSNLSPKIMPISEEVS